MDAVFLKLFNMSIAAGWLILAVIVLRLILRKAPKWLACILWAVVAVRLVCPFTVESIFSLIPSAEILNPDVVQYAQNPVIDSGIPAIDSVLNPMVSETFAPAPGASANPLYIWTYIASIIWAAGIVIMLGYAFMSLLRMYGKVREAVPMQDNVWLCDAVKSPFILGIVRPRIYLSSDVSEEQFKYVLAHEQAHLKRGDHLWKPLGYALMAVYWFQPLVWVAYILLCRDIELACDEKVIRSMDIGARKDYCKALLACSMQRKMVVTCPLAFGEVGVKERVKIVLNYRKPGFWIMTAGVVACVAIAVCFLTDPKSEAVNIAGEEKEQNAEDAISKDNVREEGGISGFEYNSDGGENTTYRTENVSAVTADAEHSEETESVEGIITFTGVIVENTMDSTEPIILVQPIGGELPYAYVCFVLPDGETEWAKEINSVVSITCRNAFEETQPPFGELLSIKRDESFADLQAMFDTFGVVIRLPGNSNWIQNREYRQPDENKMEIDYHDAVLDVDCRLLAVKDGKLNLPDIVYDASLEETWEGNSSSGQIVYIKVRRPADGSQVLVMWEYGEYQFAILADGLSRETDIGAIAKTALTVISNL